MFKSRQVVAISLLLASSPLFADAYSSAQQKNGMNTAPSFRVQLDVDQVSHYRWKSDDRYPASQSSNRRNAKADLGFSQYDAALYFPIKHDGMNLDVGLNIKFINGSAVFPGETQNHTHNFSQTIPMFYATALFDLPFEGLSAGFEGRHADLSSARAFDYKAKLSYEWSNGLGLEGGWQHQQFSIQEWNGEQPDYKSNSLFFDLRLKF